MFVRGIKIKIDERRDAFEEQFYDRGSYTIFSRAFSYKFKCRPTPRLFRQAHKVKRTFYGFSNAHVNVQYNISNEPRSAAGTEIRFSSLRFIDLGNQMTTRFERASTLS